MTRKDTIDNFIQNRWNNEKDKIDRMKWNKFFQDVFVTRI